jgi:hypothetical protein
VLRVDAHDQLSFDAFSPKPKKEERKSNNQQNTFLGGSDDDHFIAREHRLTASGVQRGTRQVQAAGPVGGPPPQAIEG